LRIGPYGAWGGRKFSKTGLTLSRLRRHPHGIDFGPLRECLPQRLFTKDRKIQLTPAVFVADLERVRAMLLSGEVATEGKLALIGRRDVRSNNSWMHNVARLVRGRNRCTILLHPDDAKRCGITDGEDCEVRSAVGAIRLPAEITDSIMAGTVSIPHGWGHGGDGVELRVALDHAGASINHLTDDVRIDAVSGNAAFSGVEVVVGAVELIER
ncbi:MAG: molybdopterin dinucleotide binding domain-containing protein, partial [Gemmatimonadales bacterium]